MMPYIERKWKEFKEYHFGNAPDMVLEDARDVFFAGALAIFTSVSTDEFDPNLINDELVRWLKLKEERENRKPS